MAKRKEVWVVRWEYCEYGGPSTQTSSSYHITYEGALKYKEQREDYGRQHFFEDGYRHAGSNPTVESVSRAEYRKIAEECQRRGESIEEGK